MSGEVDAALVKVLVDALAMSPMSDRLSPSDVALLDRTATHLARVVQGWADERAALAVERASVTAYERGFMKGVDVTIVREQGTATGGGS